MRTLVWIVFLAAGFGSASAETGGCPGLEKAAREYIAANFSEGDDEHEQPRLPAYHLRRLTVNVSVAELKLPAADGKTRPQPVLVFFAAGEGCAFVHQADGEITETVAAGSSRYLFVRSEAQEENEERADYSVLRISAEGEVSAARDQHGQEIYLEETLQKNCPNMFTGSAAVWSRETGSPDRVVIRRRQTDRDGKCRIVSDSSSFTYYRITDEHWELDDGESEEVASRPYRGKQALNR